MRKIYLILTFCFYSCGKSEEQGTKKCNIITIGKNDFEIVKGSDNHDYYVQYWSHGATIEHYIDCKLCTKRNEKN